MPSANIRTPRLRDSTNSACRSRLGAVPRRDSVQRHLNRVMAILLGTCLLFGGADGTYAQATRARTHSKKKSKKPKVAPCRMGCAPDTSAPEITAPTSEDAASQKELAELTRGLRTAAPDAHGKLSAYAAKNSSNIWGARAALALGYDDYAKNHLPQAMAWLSKAKSDTLLREYALYWSAQTARSLKRTAQAFADLKIIHRDYPDTAMKEQFLEIFAPTAVESGHPQDAVEALNGYPATSVKPALLLERAQAYTAAGQFARAAKDYQLLFYKYPLSNEAKAAETVLRQIINTLGGEYPYPGVEMQEQRAQLFFDAHKWKEARSEFEKLLKMLRDPANPKRQHAELRLTQARLQLKGSPAQLASLGTPDADVDAERLYILSQAYRSTKNESEMLSAIGTLTDKYPQSKWTEEGLMAAGNYYWVQLDRVKAIGYYQRVLDTFPAGKNAYNAEWRIAWIAYLNRQADADEKLTVFLRKYPVSSNASDALYWLGRNAERSGDKAHARSYFRTDSERFPQTYFARAARERLALLGDGEEDPPEFLAAIPAPPVLRAIEEPIPAAAADRWAKAQALRLIAFDSSAEMELKDAYYATGAPRLLLEAAQAAFDQGHFGAGMAYGRMMIPSFDSRKFSEVPIAAWKALYPLPYEAALRREAARNNFDPMLAAGLIRQESTFQADAVSHANAIGLMQVLPKTGKLLAKQLKVRYTKNKLFEADYNLQLGMVYISNLLRQTGAPEYAAAAYNAGEDRIAAWRAERNYEEIAELVESIPFTETREYVQIVLRNAEIYRMIYGSEGAQPAGSVSRSR